MRFELRASYAVNLVLLRFGTQMSVGPLDYSAAPILCIIKAIILVVSFEKKSQELAHPADLGLHCFSTENSLENGFKQCR